MQALSYSANDRHRNEKLMRAAAPYRQATFNVQERQATGPAPESTTPSHPTNLEADSGSIRHYVKYNVDSPVIAPIDGRMHFLVIEPPQLAVLHRDALSAAIEDAAAGAVKNEMMAISFFIVLTFIDMLVNLPPRFQPHYGCTSQLSALLLRDLLNELAGYGKTLGLGCPHTAMNILQVDPQKVTKRAGQHRKSRSTQKNGLRLALNGYCSLATGPP